MYTSPETGRTLYAGVGSNLTVAARSDELGAALLAADDAGDKLKSDALKMDHTLTLQTSGQAAALSITWDSASLDVAREEMEQVKVTGGPSSFTLKPVEFKTVGKKQVVNTDVEANTSVSYDEATGKAIMTVTFQPGETGTYTIKTPKAAGLTLYRVGELPKLNGVSVSSGTATVTGTNLNEYSTILVTAVDADNPDNTRLLGKVENGTFSGGSVDVSLTFPADMPSGSYTIQAAAYDEDRTVAGMAETVYTHTNANQPGMPTVSAPTPAGDCKVSFQVTGGASDVTGYRVNFYDEKKEIVPGVSGVELAKNDKNTYLAGGRYSYNTPDELMTGENPPAKVQSMGLQPNKTYTMGVSAYTVVGNVRVYSEEATSQVTIPEPIPTKITWSANAASTPLTQSRTTEDGVVSYTTDSYAVNSFIATLTADRPVTGAWTLDGGKETEVASESAVTVSLQDLSEGSHTLQFWGTNGAGDAFRFTKIFQVDTTPPLLQLSGPEDGSFFDGNGVTLSGLAEGTTLTLAVDGTVQPEINVNDGVFSIPITLDTESARHVLTLTATDASGNKSVRTRTLVNAALGQMTALALYQDGKENITGKTVEKATAVEDLELRAVLKDGRTLLLNDPTLVDWSLQATAGAPALENGKLKLAKGDVAMVQASFQVSDAGARTAYAIFDMTKEGPEPENPEPEKPGPDSPGTDVTPSSHTGFYGVVSPRVPHGTVSVSPTRAKYGQQVQMTVMPEKGYILAALTVEDSRGRQVPLTDLGGGKFSFQMPGGEVTVNAVFRERSEVSSCERGAGCPAAAFDDVDSGAWYHDGVHYCIESGLMQGFSGGRFGPNETLSRAMLAQILYSQADKPAISGNSTFEDVASGAWYAKAVAWAAAQGIVSGYGSGKFGPDDNITREQLAVMLWQYAGRPASGQSLDAFTDRSKVSAWAMDALRWAVEQRIVSGKGGGVLDPTGQATRAEAATMLMRYCESLILQ